MNRADGTKLKVADPMYKIASYVMDKRTECEYSLALALILDCAQKGIYRAFNAKTEACVFCYRYHF